MQARFKVGDLIWLNSFGQLVVEGDTRFGIVIAGPFNILVPANHSPELVFWAYDIMVGSQLITLVPQEFLERMTKDEEDNEKMEEIPDRSKEI